MAMQVSYKMLGLLWDQNWGHTDGTNMALGNEQPRQDRSGVQTF